MVDPSGAPDPPPGFPNPPRDRLELWVRVIFGALFGVLFSGVLWLRYFYEIEFGWLMVPINGLICALAFARYGDNLWTSLRGSKWLGWW
jgi:hypothetical protein